MRLTTIFKSGQVAEENFFLYSLLFINIHATVKNSAHIFMLRNVWEILSYLQGFKYPHCLRFKNIVVNMWQQTLVSPIIGSAYLDMPQYWLTPQTVEDDPQKCAVFHQDGAPL